MRSEDVEYHYRRAGYSIERRPLLGRPGRRFRPDFLVERGSDRRAVLVSERPVPLDELKAFARKAREHDLEPTLIAPIDDEADPAVQAEGFHRIDPATADPSDFLSRFTPQPAGPGLVGHVYPDADTAAQVAPGEPEDGAPGPSPWLWVAVVTVALLLVTSVLVVVFA